MASVILIITSAALHYVSANLDDGFCCSKTSGSCRTACLQMSAAAVEANMVVRERKFKAVNVYCPSTFADFWHCMNHTISRLRDGDGWSGRHCCKHANSQVCLFECVLSANSSVHLSDACRKGDELLLYGCLDRQKEADDCCGHARTPECLNACNDAFHIHSKQLDARKVCTTRVLECLRGREQSGNDLNSAPVQFLRCCNKSDNAQCRDACDRILKFHKISFHQIFDHLERSNCGLPLPNVRLSNRISYDDPNNNLERQSQGHRFRK